VLDHFDRVVQLLTDGLGGGDDLVVVATDELGDPPGRQQVAAVLGTDREGG
jgi:hypothetical protein